MASREADSLEIALGRSAKNSLWTKRGRKALDMPTAIG